ncbi:MAG: hypothetical protein HYZ38_11635 [Mycobacterium sp.]|nr:hypothetical protein [Mycobacterium sp.]
MSQHVDLSPTERAAVAMRAIDDLGDERDDRALLRLRCGRSHHVGAVFDTAIGAVFESRVGPHAHGDRDFIDVAHQGGRHGTRFADLLQAGPMTSDIVPAGCECGTHELSRKEMQKAIAAHRRNIILS